MNCWGMHREKCTVLMMNVRCTCHIYCLASRRQHTACIAGGGYHDLDPPLGGIPGVCGDPFKPAAESGTPESDFFGKPCDPIVTYEEGQIIDLEVNVNANHGGNFEFKLCDQPGGAFPDQSCFDAHILKRCACADNKCSISNKHKGPWVPISCLKRVLVYMLSLIHI